MHKKDVDTAWWKLELEDGEQKEDCGDDDLDNDENNHGTFHFRDLLLVGMALPHNKFFVATCFYQDYEAEEEVETADAVEHDGVLHDGVEQYLVDEAFG